MESAAMYALFIRCMRAFLHEEPAPALDLTPQEWGKLYHLAKAQNLAGALYTVTQTHPVPDAVRDRLRRDGFLTLAAFETQQVLMRDITATLIAKEIAPLYFKGAVVRQYYPTPALRCMGDIDLLVHRRDMERARAAMEAIGFTCTSDRGEVWVYERNRYFVEIHSRAPLYDVYKQTTLPFEDAWLYARQQKDGTYRWSYETEAMFALSHFVKHFCNEGCGLRQLMDIAVLFEHRPDEELWAQVLDRLKPYGAHRFARRLLYLCRLWFGTPIPDSLVAPLSEALTVAMAERLLGDGVFGADARMMLAAERKERQLAKKGGKAGHLLRWLFPPASAVKARYRYAQKSPLLVPAAYVHRAFDGVTANRRIHKARWRYSREQHDTLDAEVQFFKDIGL